ncbi:MAG: glycosyltransferase family 4 protein [Kiritimatiellae bacterium]|nr:glycosyltransferase family 4 protein [Kiritimatiellia bacterium]
MSGRILTNMAFFQSEVWKGATESICREGESPDTLGAMRQAWRLLKLRRRGGEVAAVVTMGPRASLAYGVGCGVLGLRSRQVLCEVFLDEAREGEWTWRAKRRLFQWVAGRSLGVIVNSSAERRRVAVRFGIPEEKVVFVPLCTTVAEVRQEVEQVGAAGRPQVLTAGRTGRDLATFWEVARRVPEAEFVAIVGRGQALPAGEVPKNLRVVRECAWEAYLEQLGQAAVVALPLLASERSTGQVVLLEAMSLGKAVVTTRTTGTVDYVREGETGLLVAPGDALDMAKAVQGLLANRERRQTMGARALVQVQAELLPDAHAARRLAAVRELAGE